MGVTHFTKGTSGNDPVERVTGSLAFGALPRIVMAAAKRRNHDGDLTAPRILVLAKSNIGPSGGGFGYDIDAAPLYDRLDIIATRIAWQGQLEGTARIALWNQRDVWCELMTDDDGELLRSIEAAETEARLEALGKLIPRCMRSPDLAAAKRLRCQRPRRKTRDEALADIVEFCRARHKP